MNVRSFLAGAGGWQRWFFTGLALVVSVGILVWLRGVHARVESLGERFDVVTSRAFATLADFANWSAATLADGGVWMAMKGKHPADELAALPPGVEVFHVEQLVVPGLDAERCIVWMRRRAGCLGLR